MKRGFEENVPKVRPRVRLGRALDEQLSGVGEDTEGSHGSDSHASEVTGSQGPQALHAPEPGELPARTTEPASRAPLHFERSAAPPPALSRPPPPAADDGAQARRDRLADVRSRATAAAEPLTPSKAPPSQAPAEGGDLARRARRGVQHVTALAKELSAELELAAEANSRLKVDLDGALTSLRRAAEESREREGERDRLAAELEKRTAAARDLLAELELLEAERDGALGQVARFSRELREARARAEEQARGQEKQKAEFDDARSQLRRLAAELEARVAERDAARGELSRLRAEKDELSEALLAARAEADEALESRSALEEIERALGEARTRVAGIR